MKTGLAGITKGSRITASWLHGRTVPLAGVQNKFELREVSVTGVIVHLRGDHPIAPDQWRAYIDPDNADHGLLLVRPIGCTHAEGHVEILPEHIRHVEEP